MEKIKSFGALWQYGNTSFLVLKLQTHQKEYLIKISILRNKSISNNGLEIKLLKFFIYDDLMFSNNKTIMLLIDES